GYEKKDVDGLLKNRLAMARKHLEDAREAIKALCEYVEPPRNTQAYIHYFCAKDPLDKDAIKENEPKRLTLYKAVSALLRAYADLANEMIQAGYTPQE